MSAAAVSDAQELTTSSGFFRTFFSRRRWSDSLAARVTHTLWVVPLVISIGFTIGILRIWELVQLESAQRNNASLAKGIAGELQPFYVPAIDEPGARSLLYHYLILNPMIDIYLVAEDGGVISRFALRDAPTGVVPVDVAPLKRFLAEGERLRLPLFGTDPSAPEQPTVFSVERFSIRGIPAYLYVVLVNERSRHTFHLSLSSVGVRYGLAISLTIAVAATLVGELVMRRTFRRFDGIMDAVRSFERGDFSVSGPEHGNDELGRLGTAVNSMARKISSSFTALESKDALRRELIANIWHDIKSPVASVSLLIDLLKREATGEGREKLADNAVANIAMLTRFLDELRELGRLEANEIVPDLALCSLENIIDEIELSVAHRAQSRGLRFRTHVDDGLPLVRADETLIVRVLLNLIDNAMRYTSANGSVEVAVLREGTGVKIAVRDTGTGISETDLPHIFERTFQAAGSSESFRGSAGLGLAIVKKIVELHGSLIHVKSGVGIGTEFSFILPAA